MSLTLLYIFSVIPAAFLERESINRQDWIPARGMQE